MNPVLALLIASIVEFFAVIAIPNYTPTYPLVVGIVSIVGSAVLIIVQGKNPEVLLKVVVSGVPKVGGLTVEMLFAFTLFIWWGIAAGIMTFQGPFTATTNGYFATWAGLISSAMLLGASVPAMSTTGKSAKEKLMGVPLFLFLICSLIVLFAALQSTAYFWESVYGAVAAGIGVFYCLLFLLLDNKVDAKTEQIATLVMLILWIVECGICTFRLPFVVTGNGYFASWVGLCVVGQLSVPFLPFGMAKAAEMTSATRQSNLTLDHRGTITNQSQVEIKVEEPAKSESTADAGGGGGGGGLFGWFGGGGAKDKKPEEDKPVPAAD